MSDNDFNTNHLPDKLSELLEVALACIQMCWDDPSYVFQMEGSWKVQVIDSKHRDSRWIGYEGVVEGHKNLVTPVAAVIAQTIPVRRLYFGQKLRDKKLLKILYAFDKYKKRRSIIYRKVNTSYSRKMFLRTHEWVDHSILDDPIKEHFDLWLEGWKEIMQVEKSYESSSRR